MRHAVTALLLALTAAACGDDAAVDPVASPDPEVGKGDQGGIPANFGPRVAETWLHVDVGDLSGEASIWLEPSDASTVSFEAAGLQVDDVFSDDGDLDWEVRGGALHVVTPADGPIHVDYHFKKQKQDQGYAKNGSTIIWPYYCGNLFPCRSAPSDGMTFELEVSGYASGDKAIYPSAVDAEAPPYTLAFALGHYACQDLGKTKNKTTVSVCWLPYGKSKAMKGTKSLVAAFDWLEQHIGTYTFGKKVASVAVNWGKSAAGGMEHHPFWHIATSEMDLPLTHVHEAVHGWFGTGVRIACWEDFVLSEGTTSYLAARAIGQVAGADAEQAIWDDYADELATVLEDEDIIVWPQSCGAVDILKDGLFSNTVYMKGAFFWRAVADLADADVLDAALARFYEQHVGGAATMAELVSSVEADTGLDLQPLVTKWLRSRGNPLAK